MDFNNCYAEFQKSLKERTELDYFKRKLVKILEEKERQEERISKSIESEISEFQKTIFSEYGINKAVNYPVGTIRVWHNEKFRKIAPGKWRKIYENQSRGAMQSIRIIKSKILNAKDTDELLQIVMENVSRFQDENGQLLPIVEELKKSVDEKKGKLNASKITYNKLNDEYNKLKSDFNSIPPDFSYTQDELDSLNNLLDRHETLLNKVMNEISELSMAGKTNSKEYSGLESLKNFCMSKMGALRSSINTVQKKLNEKEAEKNASENNSNTENLTDEDWIKINKVQEEYNNIIKSLKWEFEVSSLAVGFCQKTGNDETDNAKKQWLKLHGITSFKSLTDLMMNDWKKHIKELKEEKERKKKERHEKHLAKVKKQSGEYKAPESTKEYKKLDLSNMPETFSSHEATVKKAIDFMNNNKAENNDINYLYSNAFAMDSIMNRLRKNFGGKPVGAVDLQVVSDGGCYSPANNVVQIDYTNTTDGVQTFIHEMAHYFDHALATERSKYTHQESRVTQNDELLKAVKDLLLKKWEDIPEPARKLIESYELNTEYMKFKKEANEKINALPNSTHEDFVIRNVEIQKANAKGKKLWKYHVEQTRSIGAFEDMVNALCGGKVKGHTTWGHSYFNSVAHRTSELLANYCALSFTNKEQLKVFKECFPSVAMQLDKTIATMVKNLDDNSEINKSFNEKMNILLREIQNYGR